MLRLAALSLVAACSGACWQPTGRIEYVVPSPASPQTGGAVMLSAHFSRDAVRDREPADAIVVVFDRELDATSLVARAFMVVSSDGSRVRADRAVLAPASESDENRTVTLWGDFGDPTPIGSASGPGSGSGSGSGSGVGARTPTDVVVIDRIWDEAGGPLLGTSAKVSAYEQGPRPVAIRSSSAREGLCTGATQVVRMYWSDDVLDVGDDDLARIDVELADGRTVHPQAFDDTAANGTDTHEDNVLELCLADSAEARIVRVAPGSFRGPAGQRTGRVVAAVGSDPQMQS